MGPETFQRLSSCFLGVSVLMISNSGIVFSEEENRFQQLEQQASIPFRWSSEGLPMIDFKVQSEFSNLKYTFPHSARIILSIVFLFILANNTLLFIKTKLLFWKLVFWSQL